MKHTQEEKQKTKESYVEGYYNLCKILCDGYNQAICDYGINQYGREDDLEDFINRRNIDLNIFVYNEETKRFSVDKSAIEKGIIIK